jgi:hypothetical protein
MGGLCYIFVLIMEIGICASHAVWLFRTRKVRAAASKVGLSYESYVELEGKDKEEKGGSGGWDEKVEKPPAAHIRRESV